MRRCSRLIRRRGSAATLVAFAVATLVLGIIVGSGAEVAPMALEARRAGPEHQALVLAEAAACVALDELAAGREPTPFAGARLGEGSADLHIRSVDAAHIELLATGRAPAPLLLGPGGMVARRLKVVVGGRPARVVAWEELP